MNKSRRLLLVCLTGMMSLAVVGVAAGWLKPEETTITEVAPGVFFRKLRNKPEFIGCNQGWVIFKDFVLVIDANFPNQADEVVGLIRKMTDKPIRFVFDTHYHGDHADGNPIYAKIGATAIASENSRDEFKTKGRAGFEAAQKDKPAEYGPLTYQYPGVYFPKKLVLEDETQRVELLYFGHGHTVGDAVAWLPRHGILFTGDSCLNGPFNYLGDSNTASWIAVLGEMAKLPIKVVCPGHGEMSDASLLEKQRRYFFELRQEVADGIAAGKSLDEIKAGIRIPFFEDWTGVPASERVENITHVYGELTKK